MNSSERCVIGARPPMGPRIATPVAAIKETLCSATGGSTPLATALTGPAVVPGTKFSVTPKNKSVTHVLNHRCYLCPDCARNQHRSEHSSFSYFQNPNSTSAALRLCVKRNSFAPFASFVLKLLFNPCRAESSLQFPKPLLRWPLPIPLGYRPSYLCVKRSGH